ncbi:MAG: hypothetical protein ACR2MQ_07125 [Gemmatimonadaceae bacterium]
MRATAVYDGAAFADVSGGVRQGTTYLGTLNLELGLSGGGLAGRQHLPVCAPNSWRQSEQSGR